MKKFCLVFSFLPNLVIAQSLFPAEQQRIIADTSDDWSYHVAKPFAPQESIPSLLMKNAAVQKISDDTLHDYPYIAQTMLSQAIYRRDVSEIKRLLDIYQNAPSPDEILILYAQGKIALLESNYEVAIKYFRQIIGQHPDLNPVRIELAIALFHDQQNSAALNQFEKAGSVQNLPTAVRHLIATYKDALLKRNTWHINGHFYYDYNKNVNNTSYTRQIEDTSYYKMPSMLPQSANGIAYGLSVARDFNLINSHYLRLENDLSGKEYWDNKDFSEITNRFSLGYTYKKANATLSILPFYEKRWLAGSSYAKTQGIRIEGNYWLSPQWQVSSAFEYGKNRYTLSQVQDGYTQLLSTTLLWLPNPKQFFYLGVDFNREKTLVRQYSSDTKSVRLGWGQEWEMAGLSTRTSLTYAKRDYKAEANLGGLLPLGKVRSDKVYGAQLTVWKRDWHLFGLTPKVRFFWRKHDSNLPSLYSYTNKGVQVLVEAQF